MSSNHGLLNNIIDKINAPKKILKRERTVQTSLLEKY